MAQDKKSIVVYSDWIKKFEALSDDEAGRLIKHFFRYVNDLNPTPPDRITELSFIDIEQCLKRDLVKWEKRAERSRENGRSGGRPIAGQYPEKPKETQQVILEPRKPDNVNGNVSVNVNGTVIKSKGEMLSPFDQAFNDYLDMRKKIRKPMTPKAIELVKRELDKLGKTEAEQILILEQSIRNSWQGVFLLKTDFTKEKGSAQKEKVSKFEQNSNSIQQAKQYLAEIRNR